MPGLHILKGVVFLYVVVTAVTPVEMLIQPFVTPGIPACYVSRSNYEYVEGLSKLCPHTNSTIRSDCGGGVEKYFYCSKDHECCLNNGCPACCVDREYLNTKEVGGIVFGCIVVTFIILGITYACAGKFCQLYKTS